MVVTLSALAVEEEVAVVASALELTSVVVEAVETVPTHVEMVMVLVEDNLHSKDLDQVLQHHLSVVVMQEMVLL
jgi:predicted CoA-binding protein